MNSAASSLASRRPLGLKRPQKRNGKYRAQILELPLIRQVSCNLCGGNSFELVLTIKSSRHENFQVVSCKACSLLQVNPQPNAVAVKPYYGDNYFLKRTKRGYDNYYSESLRREIRRVYQKNLVDLKFEDYERKLQIDIKKRKKSEKARALDVGCAAGYFVEFLQERGWRAEGIELADAPAQAGRRRGLKIYSDDFLTTQRLKPRSYHLISFWASIEHMHNPYAVFEQSAKLLKSRGRLLLSTCRYAWLAKLQKEKWRYMNVPEHLYFFTPAQIEKMAQRAGFQLVASVSYGSGLTRKKNMSYFYAFAKILLDFLSKALGQGDMMALHFQKNNKKKQ